MQGNTEKSFRDKWEKNPNLVFDSTLSESSDVFNWILRRNGFENAADLRRFLSKKTRILDAGCGNGRVTALLRNYSDATTTPILGFDLTSAEVAKENLKEYANVEIHSGDLLGDLTRFGKFDFIYCQEVLHHTRDPRAAFHNLCGQLTEDGEIAIYVYKLKAPIREFVDDYVRERIASLSYEEASAVCSQITDLGRSLAKQKVKITVPDVNILGIQAGDYDLQRFVYHFFMKCFWNDELSPKENVAINYDWYHPELCSRHQIEEVREWFAAAGLTIVQESVDFYGITIRGAKAQ